MTRPRRFETIFVISALQSRKGGGERQRKAQKRTIRLFFQFDGSGARREGGRNSFQTEERSSTSSLSFPASPSSPRGIFSTQRAATARRRDEDVLVESETKKIKTFPLRRGIPCLHRFSLSGGVLHPRHEMDKEGAKEMRDFVLAGRDCIRGKKGPCKRECEKVISGRGRGKPNPPNFASPKFRSASQFWISLLRPWEIGGGAFKAGAERGRE